MSVELGINCILSKTDSLVATRVEDGTWHKPKVSGLTFATHLTLIFFLVSVKNDEDVDCDDVHFQNWQISRTQVAFAFLAKLSFPHNSLQSFVSNFLYDDSDNVAS